MFAPQQAKIINRSKEPHMLSWIVEMFRKPSAAVLAQREYEESQRSLLECQRARDYYENMVNFHNMRISRLRALRAAVEE